MEPWLRPTRTLAFAPISPACSRFPAHPEDR
jgi:hypothetical protein